MDNLHGEASELVDPSLLNPIDYRKSGLSLNHVVGCPLDCAYCVRHLFGNFRMKVPTALMSDEEAVELFVNHRYFVPDRTPLQLFNRATDPFLPAVKAHTFRVLELLSKRGLTNFLLLITRFRISAEDAERLNQFEPLKLTVLLTYSGIDDERIEPIDSGLAANSLRVTSRLARSYRVVLYWRPLVPGLNDSTRHVEEAARLSKFAHATAFTGLFFRQEIRSFYEANKLPIPFDTTARRKVLPRSLEEGILRTFFDCGGVRIFRKTSCAVAFVHSQPDYNGHYGVRELCDICSSTQIERCSSAWKKPSVRDVDGMMKEMGLGAGGTVRRTG